MIEETIVKKKCFWKAPGGIMDKNWHGSESIRSECRDKECASDNGSDKDKLKQLVSMSCILEQLVWSNGHNLAWNSVAASLKFPATCAFEFLSYVQYLVLGQFSVQALLVVFLTFCWLNQSIKGSLSDSAACYNSSQRVVTCKPLVLHHMHAILVKVNF